VIHYKQTVQATQLRKTMLKIILGFIFIIPLTLHSQINTEKHFYNDKWDKCDSLSARHVEIYSYADTLKMSGIIKTSLITGQLESECAYIDIKSSIRDGASIYYHENGKVKSNSTYRKGILNGEVTTYYSDGQIKRKDQFEEGKFISGSCYTALGKDTTHFDFQVNPQFVGGDLARMKFLAEHLSYPADAAARGIGGKVVVKFIVQENGQISNVEINKSVDPFLDKEAIRVVKLMKPWIPGIEDGEKVSVLFKLPINFKLQ